MRVFGGPGQNRGLVESEKWVFVCVVCERLVVRP